MANNNPINLDTIVQLTGWSPAYVQLVIKHTGITDQADLEWFCYYCKTNKLDPLLGDAIPIYRFVEGKKKLAVVTSINVLRARCAPVCNGMTDITYRYNSEGELVSISGKIWRKDADKPFEVTVFAEDYIQYRQDGQPTSMWRKRHMMLLKCWQAMAYRTAMADCIGQLLVAEELGHEFEAARSREPLELGQIESETNGQVGRETTQTQPEIQDQAAESPNPPADQQKQDKVDRNTVAEIYKRTLNDIASALGGGKQDRRSRNMAMQWLNEFAHAVCGRLPEGPEDWYKALKQLEAADIASLCTMSPKQAAEAVSQPQESPYRKELKLLWDWSESDARHWEQLVGVDKLNPEDRDWVYMACLKTREAYVIAEIAAAGRASAKQLAERILLAKDPQKEALAIATEYADVVKS